MDPEITTQHGITEALHFLHDRLQDQPLVQIQFTKDWARFAPITAGVYAIYEGENIIYVGESGSLRGRMRDLRRTMNHTFRRSLGRSLYTDHPEFAPATSKRKFSATIESSLSAYMESGIRIRVLTVLFGRAEFEEFLISKYNPKLNKKTKRQGN